MPEAICNGIALFLAWLFAAAAVHKWHSPAYYQRLLAAYLPGQMAGRALARLIGGAELCIALLLFLPALQGLGLVAAALVLIGYAAMMGWQYARGRADLECGCSGPASTLTVGPALIARNLLCAGLAILALGAAGQFPGSPGSAVLALATGGFIIIVYLCSDQIIANAQAMAGEV